MKQSKVVTAPVMFTQAKAPKFGDRLCAALGRHPVVIADLTRTSACDLAGLGEICVANDLATRINRELRVVISSAAILSQFALAGLDAELLIFPSLSLATKPGPQAGRVKWGRDSWTSGRRSKHGRR